MVELKKPCAHAEEDKPTSPKLKMMDTVTSSLSKKEGLNQCTTAAKMFPYLEKYYCTYAKHIVDDLRLK